MEASDHRKVFTQATLKEIGIGKCNATLLRWEARGDFPRRFYLSPKCPVWNAAEVLAFLAARQTSTDPNGVTAQATIAAQTPEAQAKRRKTRARTTRERTERKAEAIRT